MGRVTYASVCSFVFYSSRFVRLLSAVPWFSSLFLYLEFSFFSFVFLHGFVLLSVGECHSLHLFCVFLLFGCLGLFSYFRLACPLTFFCLPPWGLLRVPSLVWGFSISSLSIPHLCVFLHAGFILMALVVALSVVLLFSPVCPHHIASFGLGPFLLFRIPGSSLLIPLLLFFSPLCISCPFLGDLHAVSRSISSPGGALSLSLIFAGLSL